VKNSRWLGFGFLGVSVACGATWLTACSKSDAPSPGSAVAPLASSASAAHAAPPSAPLAPTPLPAAPATADPVDGGPPASFASGKKENVENAVGLGCEAKSSSGYLELLCRKKNGTGGHPVQAVLNSATDELVPADEHGELRLVTPFKDGETRDISIEWSDTRYVLHVSGASAKLEWAAGGLELRRACAKIADESRAVTAEAQKASSEQRVLPAEAAKLPRFGVCQPAGLGSYALSLKALSGSGPTEARRLHAEIEVVHVSEQGVRLAAPWATFEFAPGGLELTSLQAYDYDDDGKDELVLAYDLKAVPAGVTPPHPATIWSFSESGVESYAKAPELDPGGASIEQLDFDMRPDLGSYGAYAAWLAADCGAKQCPTRITGPRFFAHSLPDGGFSLNDTASKAALKRACPKKAPSIVVDSLAQTAKNLVCARVYGTSIEAVTEELTAKHDVLCGSAETCPAKTTLEAWAKALPPLTLSD